MLESNHRPRPPRTLVIIPAYNEATKLPSVMSDLATNAPWADALVIDDCSQDETAQVARSLGARVLRLPCNLGVGGAMQAGYIFAAKENYDLAVQFDGDGQHRADQIVALIDEIQKGADLVIGSRLLGRRSYRFPVSRWLGARLLGGILALLNGVTVSDPTSGFRASSKKIIHFFAEHYPQSYLGDTVEALATAARHGMVIREIPARMNMTSESSINNLIGLFRVLETCLAIIIDRIERPFEQDSNFSNDNEGHKQ